MPTMELLNSEEKDIVRIFSYMYYPNNQEKRQEFIFLLETMNEANACEDDIVAIKKDDVLKLLHLPDPDSMSNEIDNIILKGCIQTGTMLHYLLCLGTSLPKKASLNNAIKLMQKLYDDTYSKDENPKIKTRTATRYWQYWKDYKSVSHLWGAWLGLTFTAKKLGYTGGVPCGTFLIESERYRLLGENHIDSKTKKPTLLPGTCWTPPEGYLPPLTLDTVKPFRPDESMLPKILASLASKGRHETADH